LRSLQADDGGYASVAIGWGAIKGLGELGVAPGHAAAHRVSAQWARTLRPDKRRTQWAGVLVTARRLLDLEKACGLEVGVDDVDALLCD
jgi:hypothetical protein